MNFTGERYVPELKGPISYEHVHRYGIAARYAAGKRVLDVASGEGYGCALLARTAQQVTGVDIDPESVEHARRTYYNANVRFLQGSCTELPLGDASVDVVSSFETIEHVDEQERMLDEIRRVLAPGGVLVLSSPNKLVYSGWPGFHNPYHVKELYFAELRDLLVRRFRHVAFYGQRLVASSIVHPLTGEARDAAWYNGGPRALEPGLPVLGKPVYFVAICSDEPLSLDACSAYVNAADDLIEQIQGELEALRERATALASAVAAQPALPASAEPDPALVAARDDDRARVAALEAHAEQRAAELEEARRAGAAEVAQLRAELDEARRARAEHGALEARLAEAAETVRRTEAELGHARSLLDEERARSSRTTLQLAELRASRGAATAEQDAAHAEQAADVLNMQERIAALTEALAQAEADSRTLREVLQSRSWKLTTPLRHAASLLRR